MNHTRYFLPALAALLFLPSAFARPSKKMALPDFTKGDSIPEGATHDWNLGATGARGWIFSEAIKQIKASKETAKLIHVK